MTPRERVFAVLNHRIPDRIPSCEIWIDALWDAMGCADPAGIYAHLGQDWVMMPSQTPSASHAWRSGIDAFGRVWQHGTYAGGVVKSRSDLEKYTPPLAYASLFWDEVSIQGVRNSYPEHCLVWGSHIGPFTAATMAMGYAGFFTALNDDPALIHRLLEARTQWCITMFQKAQNSGAEVLVVGDDAGSTGGPMISPRMWRNFIFPYHKRIVEALDVPVIWHSDGNVVSLLPMAIEAGFIGYHGVDPIAGMNLVDTQHEFGKDLVLMGNLDIRVLFADDLQAVRREVDRCITEGAEAAGYMFATCNSICEGMNPAAVIEMVRYLDVVLRT